MVTTAEVGRGSSSGGTIALDDLIVLNDEIVALVRAGIPLERGLADAGRDLSGRLGRIAGRLSERLDRGEPLGSALEAEGGTFPPLYRAVVEAGVQSGRLPAALEGLAELSRSYAETRRAIGLALFYPMLVLMLAYGLFVGFVVGVLPRFLLVFETMGLPLTSSVKALSRLGELAPYWAPIGPILFVLIGLAWISSGRSALVGSSRGTGLLALVPWMRGLYSGAQSAHFASLLGLLIDHQVPLPEALELAADVVGDDRFRASARGLAEGLRRGEPLGEGLRGRVALPPLLRWLMVAGQLQGTLGPSLKHAAATYRRRALDRAEFLRVLLPACLTVAIGASATLIYALTLFLPMTSLLDELARP